MTLKASTNQYQIDKKIGLIAMVAAFLLYFTNGIHWFGYGLAGLFVLSGLLVFGLPGLLFAVFALALIGMVFKGINLIKRKKNPDKLKGKRSETRHLVIDIVVVAGVVLGLMLLIFCLMFILGSLI